MVKTFPFTATLLATLLSYCERNVDAFSLVVPNPSRHASSIVVKSAPSSSWALCATSPKNDVIGGMSSSTTCSCEEDIEQDTPTTLPMSQPNGARIIRSAVVKDVNGDYTPLDRPMGRDKSVVIFLRHMG
mmetsp:Transcript_7779/g.14668  ORF Transcript_7779/g.14668 Transcript_7779/m.14668 type:complete len:130 (-) Transcript_7779:739-1128(-)